MLPVVSFPRYFGFADADHLRAAFGRPGIRDLDVIFASIGELSVFAVIQALDGIAIVSDVVCSRCGVQGAWLPEATDWETLSRYDFTPSGFLSDHTSDARARIASLVVQNLPANREAFDGGPRIGKVVKVPPSMFGIAPGSTPLSEYVIAGINQSGEIELVPAARS